ncbi:MAG TPA: hypothetical protein VG939_07250 [Caulobacteraceae bacterium]|nr:hypothetical protein [Caulobacteraceae bacterium]
MTISATLAGPATPTRVQLARLVEGPDKATVAADAASALSSARFSASDTQKSWARAKLQELAERVKVLKKLLAGDPKAMAKALAQVFKELKSALDAYRKAGGEELGLAGDVSSAAVGAGSASQPSSSSAGAGDGQGQAAAPPAAAPARDPALYDAVVGQVKKQIGEDGLGFIRDLRAFSNEVSDLLESSRTQARGRKPDKPTDEAFADADAALKDLRGQMQGAEQDIHAAAPLAGMRLSVEA